MKVTHILFSLLTLSVSSAWAVSYDADQKIETPLVLEGEYVVEVASGVTVEFSGEISGTGPLRKTGAGTLVLSNGNSTFTEGVQISQGYVRADKDGCLGDGRIFIDGTGSSAYPGVARQIKFNADKATFANEIVVEGWDVSGYTPELCFIATDVETTLSGSVSFSDEKLSKNCNVGIAAGNATSGKNKKDVNAVLRFTNNFSAKYVRPIAYGTIVFDGRVTVGTMTSSYNSNLYGTIELANGDNQIGVISIAGSSLVATGAQSFGGAAMTVTRAFDVTTRSAITFDGKNQTLASLQFDASNASYGRNHAAYLQTADKKLAVLTLTGGSTSTTSYQTLAGPLSLVLDAVDYPSFVQTLASRAHTMTGLIAVSNGTLTATSATFKNVPRVIVGPSGTFTVSNSTGAFERLTELVVDGTFDLSSATAPFAVDNRLEIWLDSAAQLKIPSDIRVKNVHVWDGEKYNKLGNNDYPAGSIPQITGGAVNVDNGEEEVVEATWTAGGAENRSVVAAANWDVAADKLNFSDGKLFATFASAGEVSDIDRAVVFRGLEFTRDFTLAKANASASVQILGQGLSVTSGGTNEIAAPLDLPAPQNWAIGADSVLKLSGGVMSADSGSLAVSGEGALELSGENCLAAGVVMTNRAIVLSGTIETPNHVDQGNASGSNSKELRIPRTADGDTITLDNVTIEKPLYMGGRGSASDATVNWWRIPANSTNTFVGHVWLASPIGYPDIGTNACLVFKRGVMFGGETHLRNTTVKLDGGVLQTSGSGMFVQKGACIEYNSTGNAGTYRLSDGTLDCKVDNALNGMSLYIMNNAARLRLRDHTVTLKFLASHNGSGIIEGESPATLQITNGDDSYFSGQTEGFVNIVKMGTGGTLSLRSVLQSPGDLSVIGTDDVLTLESGASWLNGTNVTVASTGKLRLLGSKQFNGKFAVLHIDDSGVVELAEGTKQTFHEMWVNGVKVEPGVYGSAEAEGVDHTYSAHFAGKGVVKVGDFGLVLMVR